MRNNLSAIPNVTVYNRDEIPARFHFSKPVHRLGEITALPNEEGLILSEVLLVITSREDDRLF